MPLVAFVDRGDARVAHVLRRAGLLDVAHAAMHLQAERGDLVADVGRQGLGDRRQQRGALAGRRARFGGSRRARRASIATAVRWQTPRAAWISAFIVSQHAPHVGMLEDRAHAAAPPAPRPWRRSRA